MFAITPELVRAQQTDRLVAGERSRRVGRSATVAPKLSLLSSLSAVARAARMRTRRGVELVPGPFAPCAC